MAAARSHQLQRTEARLTLEEFNQQYRAQLRLLLHSKGQHSEATIARLEQCVQEKLCALFTRQHSQYLFVIWDTVHGITDRELQTMNKAALKNFGLNEADFLVMIAELKKGNEELFERIFLTQFKHCQQYIQRKDSASAVDAYDATMDAMLEIRKALLHDKVQYGNLRFLFTRMARQRYYRDQKKQENVIALTDDFDMAIVPEGFTRAEFALLSDCWDDLDDDCQAILKNVYFNKVSLKDMAQEMGKTYAAMRKKKQRCLEHLKELFLQRS